MMRSLNSPWLALASVGCLCVLAAYSQGYVHEKDRRQAAVGKHVTLWSRTIPRMSTAAEMVGRARSGIRLIEKRTACGADFGCWAGGE